MSIEYDLDIPFALKDTYKKQYRLKWSSERKFWYTTFSKVNNALVKFNVIKLNVYFPKKDTIKQLGCKWSSYYKCWYCSKEIYDSNKEQIDACCIKPRSESPTIDEKLFLIDTDDEADNDNDKAISLDRYKL